ncbi:MAG: potassium transporter TrkG, partial [Bacteroidota bacterium]|nr:potassium transporter TrkG [Bacteroidota bacterium]
MKLINPLIIIRILFTVLILESISFITCLPVSIIYKEPSLPFIWSALVTSVAALILYFASKDISLKKVSSREGFISVSLSWIIFTAFGTLPYLFSGTIHSFIDAFFESSSGFTTTGSTIIPDVESLQFSILYWRSFTHWIGGLGIIVLVIIILPVFGITANHLLPLESSLKEKTHPKVKAMGLRLLYVYLLLTVTEIILLNLGDMNLFDSICHTFGTVATGGFSTKNSSICGYSAYSQYIISLFMFLSGVSFIVYYYMVKLNFRKVKYNEELWFYLGTTIISGTIATCILLAKTTKPLEPAFREGFFQVISVITTTGYVTTDYLKWPQAGMVLLFILLFAGGCTGSTAGSIKMVRHLIVLKNIRSTTLKLLHPNVITQIKLNNKQISEQVNISIISFVVEYIFIFLVGTIIVVITGLDPVTAAS